MKKNIYFILLIILSILSFIYSCKTTEPVQQQDSVTPKKSKKNIISKEIFNLGNKTVPVSSTIEVESHNLSESIAKFDSQKKTTILNSRDDYKILQLVYKNAKVGTIKNVKDKLWFYFTNSTFFYDEDWYYFDKDNNKILKGQKNFFDVDLITSLTPKYNNTEYYKFRKEDFYITLYKFNKKIYSWLNSEFYDEIKDTDIRCIAIDEDKNKIWFGLGCDIQTFDMNTKIWDTPYKDRSFAELCGTDMRLKKILIDKDYVWLIGFDGNLVLYDKNKDTWDPIKNIANSYLFLIETTKDYFWFGSDNGIWLYNRNTTHWEKFNFTNHLSDKTIKNITKDGDNYWLETNKELSYLNLEKMQWKIFRKSDLNLLNNEQKPYLNAINDMIVINNQLWLTTNQGVLVYNLINQNWLVLDRLRINDYFNLDIEYFTSLFSYDGYLWIGSDNSLFRIKL